MPSMLIRPWQQAYSIDIHRYSMAVLLFCRQELSGAFLHLSVWVQMAGLRLTSQCLVTVTWYLHPASSSRHFLNNFNLWTFVCQGWWFQSGEGSGFNMFQHSPMLRRRLPTRSDSAVPARNQLKRIQQSISQNFHMVKMPLPTAQRDCEGFQTWKLLALAPYDERMQKIQTNCPPVP